MGAASGGFSQNASTVAGYNTTAAGSTFLQFIPSDNPATLRFNATTPLSAFGAYFTGVGTSSGDIALRFNDGTQQSLPVPTSSTGGVQFFGFTSSGSQLTQVEFHMSNVPATGSVDFWGIDDATFATVPEPAALTAAAATSLLLRRRVRR